MFQENSIETCILSRVKQITSPGWMHEISARTWCTGKTQRERVEREVGGGIGMGNTCKPMAVSFQCMTKSTTIKKIKKIKKKESRQTAKLSLLERGECHEPGGQAATSKLSISTAANCGWALVGGCPPGKAGCPLSQGPAATTGSSRATLGAVAKV